MSSLIKNSFSMTSLRSSSGCLESPDRACVQLERPYNSLNKKKKDDVNAWRHSWGSQEVNKDEFWAALQSDYNYLMGNQLIESCQVASVDSTLDGVDYLSTLTWSFNEFMEKYTALYAWLNDLQEKVYATSNRTEGNRAFIEELATHLPHYKELNEQAHGLFLKLPHLKEELSWRVAQLNGKWETLQQAITPGQEGSIHRDLEEEVHHLRVWLREMESLLQPLNFHIGWTMKDLEEKAQQQQAVQRDIESHGKLVCWIVRQCEEVLGSPQCGFDEAHAQRVVRGLERRWHQLWLRSLEWQCLIDNLLRTNTGENLNGYGGLDSDEEPLTKYPRLGATLDLTDQSNLEHIIHDIEVDELENINQIEDDDVMDTDVLCELSNPTDELFTPLDSMVVNSSTSVMVQTSFSIPSSAVNSDEDSLTTLSDNTLSSGLRKDVHNSPNCATYYFEHVDTDTEYEVLHSTPIKEEEDSSVDEWELTSSSGEKRVVSTSNIPTRRALVKLDFGQMASTENSSMQTVSSVVLNDVKCKCKMEHSRDSIYKLVNGAEKLVQHGREKKGWMHRRKDGTPNMQIGDSCDASAEYTSSDSDSFSSEDSDSIGKSTLDYMSPLQRTLLHDLGLPKVTLRNRKRASLTKDRPNSLCETTVLPLESTRGPVSASETALHLLHLLGHKEINALLKKFDVAVSSSTDVGLDLRSAPRRKLKSRKRTQSAWKKGESDGSQTALASSEGPPKNSRTYSLTLHNRTSNNLVKKSTSVSGSVGVYEVVKPELQYSSEPLGVYSSFRKCEKEDKETISSPRTEGGYAEPVWDNYVDKYMSEPYSEEPFDPEATKQLLDFGEDYRNFIDSHSDGASSRSGLQPISITRKRRSGGTVISRSSEVLDSDSDMEDLRHLIQQSRSQLTLVEDHFHLQLVESSTDSTIFIEHAEIAATCQENIKCLKFLINNLKNTGSYTSTECQEISAIVAHWEHVECEVWKSAEVDKLRKDISVLKEFFTRMYDKLNGDCATDVDNLQELQRKIEDTKSCLIELSEKRSLLKSANASALTAQIMLGGACIGIREEVNELYRLSEENLQKGTVLFRDLQALFDIWQLFESQRRDLQKAFDMDRTTLCRLDSRKTSCQSILTDEKHFSSGISTDSENGEEKSHPMSRLGCVNSDSSPDSGVSDSDFEIQNRQQRLDFLRQYADHLKSALKPDSPAMKAITECLVEAEVDLENLRHSYEIVMKSSLPAVTQLNSTTQPKLDRRASDVSTQSRKKKGRPRFARIWKILRIALTFQVALLGVLSIAYLLQPECCDFTNTYCLTWSPQLTYINGLPPV